MGAGAATGRDAEKLQHKLQRFEGKILLMDTLSERQRIRLVEQMSHELKKIVPPPVGDHTKHAATKIQSIQRTRSIKKEQRRWVKSDTLFNVYECLCKAYRLDIMTIPVFIKFCKECKVVEGKYKEENCNAAWNEICGSDAKTVPYELFLQLLAYIGEDKGEVVCPDEVSPDFDLVITITHYSHSGENSHLIYGLSVVDHEG